MTHSRSNYAAVGGRFPTARSEGYAGDISLAQIIETTAEIKGFDIRAHGLSGSALTLLICVDCLPSFRTLAPALIQPATISRMIEQMVDTVSGETV